MITAKCKLLFGTCTGIYLEGKDIDGLTMIVSLFGPEDKLNPFRKGSPLVLVIPEAEGLKADEGAVN